MGVLKGPLNGIEDGPVVQGVGLDEVEDGRWRGEASFGKEQRPGGSCGGLKEGATRWVGEHGLSFRLEPEERRFSGRRGSTIFSPEFAGRLIGKYNELW